MANRKYSKLEFNINKRALIIDNEKIRQFKIDLETTDMDDISTKYIKKVISAELEKELRLYGLSNDRYDRKGNLVLDKLHLLSRFSKSEFNYFFTLDLKNYLAMSLSRVFDCDEFEIQEWINILTIKHDISEKCLAYLILNNRQSELEVKPVVNILIEDLMTCEPIKNFILDRIKVAMEGKRSMLYINGVNYSNFYSGTKEQELPTALRLFILDKLSNVIKDLVVSFYEKKRRENLDGIIWSQDLTTITIASNSELFFLPLWNNLTNDCNYLQLEEAYKGW